MAKENLKNGMTIEEHLKKVQSDIENYQPETEWEKANGRTLRRLISLRNRLEKRIERNNKNGRDSHSKSPRTAS